MYILSSSFTVILFTLEKVKKIMKLERDFNNYKRTILKHYYLLIEII